MFERLFLSALLVMLLVPSIAFGQSDKMGFNWDINAAGVVEDGTEDAFDGAFMLYVDSDQFDGSSGLSEKNGMRVFGPEAVGQASVTRHVLIVDDPPGIVYADSYQNKTGANISITASIHSDFGDAATPQPKLNAEGRVVAMLYPHGQPRPTIVCLFGDANAKFLPSLSGGGDTYAFQFPTLELLPEQTKTIGYFVAQRRNNDGAKVFDDEQAFSRTIAKIAALGNFSFVNMAGMGIYDTGNLKLMPQESTDYLETRKHDQVYGTLLTREFDLETEIGKRSYMAEQIVNVVGVEDGRYKIAATDGSVLEGVLRPEKVKFELSDGGQGEIETVNIARIVPRNSLADGGKDAKFGKWFNFQAPIFIFVSKDRLTGQLNNETLKVHTELGILDIPVGLVESIQFTPGETGQQVRLGTTDGQFFSGNIYEDIEVVIFDGSVKKISPKNLSAIFFGEGPETRSRSAPPDRAYFKLNNQGFLFAKFLVDQKPLEFETAFGTRTINPEQISLLEMTPGIMGGLNITLWDGSKLRGKLTSEKLLVEVLGADREIPASMIQKFINPLSMPPANIREQYIKTIRQLGSKKYQERAAAIRMLEKDGAKIRGLLKSQLDHVDVETKARIWKLLPEADRPKKDKTPSAKNGEKLQVPAPDNPNPFR